MFQVRLHGRGGQGVVTAAELLSVAAFLDGKEAVAFPSFGSERTGAPVTSYCRVDHNRIRTREPIEEPDAVVITDPTLLHHVDVFAGLKSTGYVLINSAHSVSDLGLDEIDAALPVGHCVAIPASEAARQHTGKSVANVCLLGAFAAMTDVVTIKSLESAVHEWFVGTMAETNTAAARACYTRFKETDHA